MRTKRAGPVICASLLLLTACGSASDEAEAPQPPPVEDTAFGDAVGAMDKARGVQDVLEQDKQALDRAIEASAGAGDHSTDGAHSE